jgi:hypothetical protein
MHVFDHVLLQWLGRTLVGGVVVVSLLELGRGGFESEKGEEMVDNVVL